MKKVIGLLVIVACVVVAYKFSNTSPDATRSPDEQMQIILADGGCVYCHTKDPRLPFYANYPIVKNLVTKDIKEGYKFFDINPTLRAIAKGEAIPDVDLAKIEASILEGSMPPPQYYLIHWGSSLTSEKAELALVWIKNHRAKFYPNALAAPEFKNETVRPIPDALKTDSRKVALGKLLYHDTRLSGDGTVSCATCHGINTGGVDNLKYSEGIRKQLGGVNAPTTFNACFNMAQFWDGRAATLEEQAGGPPLNPVEMGSKSFDEIIAKLSKDSAFVKAFKAVYPEGLMQTTITDAIAEYERTLITPNSPFDRYLKGDKNALTSAQIDGYALFKKNKCATCHAGVNMGGLSYELMGQRNDYFKDRALVQKSGLTDSDYGRWAQTKQERDRYRFKTPSLRNVALTFPYYHDGSVKTLKEAIESMARYQVGRELSDADVNKLEQFLLSLTGKYENKTLENTNKQK